MVDGFGLTACTCCDRSVCTHVYESERKDMDMKLQFCHKEMRLSRLGGFYRSVILYSLARALFYVSLIYWLCHVSSIQFLHPFTSFQLSPSSYTHSLTICPVSPALLCLSVSSSTGCLDWPSYLASTRMPPASQSAVEVCLCICVRDGVRGRLPTDFLPGCELQPDRFCKPVPAE